MNVLSDIYSVFWVDLRNMRRHWRSTVVSSLVLPLLYLVAFGYGLGRDINVGEVSYLAFVVPGIVALTSFSASFNGAASKLQVDRLFYKSFDELLMSPIRPYSIILGKTLIGTLRGLLSAFAILAIGLLLSETLLISPLFIAVLFASCFVFALFGVLVALVINSHQNMNTFSNLVILPMTFLCGTFFSLNQLPEAAKIVLSALPLTQSSVCLRAAALNQDFPWVSLAALLCFGVAFFIGSMYALKKTSI
ncbi:MAG: ABC transporter permease [Candidatus Bathyarchaeia archaeon]|jgi:ABC-type multidrug transport system permease subunit